MSKKKLLALLTASALTVGLLSGCGGGGTIRQFVSLLITMCELKIVKNWSI